MSPRSADRERGSLAHSSEWDEAVQWIDAIRQAAHRQIDDKEITMLFLLRDPRKLDGLLSATPNNPDQLMSLVDVLASACKREREHELAGVHGHRQTRSPLCARLGECGALLFSSRAGAG